MRQIIVCSFLLALLGCKTVNKSCPVPPHIVKSKSSYTRVNPTNKKVVRKDPATSQCIKIMNAVIQNADKQEKTFRKSIMRTKLGEQSKCEPQTQDDEKNQVTK